MTIPPFPIGIIIFHGRWMGSIQDRHGIFPANYVGKIGNGLQQEDFDAQSILKQLDRVLRLKFAIAQADPLGYNLAENEKLQVYYF